MPRQPRLSSQANRREVMQRNRNKKFRMELRQRLRFAKHFKTPIIIPLRGFFSEKPNGDTPESHQLAEPQHQNPIPLENMGEPHISTHNPNNLATSMGTPTVRKLDSSDQRTSSERANDEPSGKRTSNFAPSSYHSYQPCSDRSSDEQRAFQHQPTSQGIQSGHLHIARFIPGESPSRSPPLHNQLSPISGRLRHVLAIARHGISERYIEPELEESVGSVGQDDIEIDNNMTPINILTWNARGAASADFCLAIMDLKTCHLPRVVFISEIKVGGIQAENIIKSIVYVGFSLCQDGYPRVIERRRSNRILALQDQSGNWLYNPLEIKDHITDYFFNCFTASPVDNIDVNLPLPSISSSDKISLSTMPNALDIKNALFSLKPYKAPGVDGFQAAFFQKYWDVFSNDIILSIQDIFSSKSYNLNVKWNPPNFGWWKLNSDGACSGNLGPFAISGIIRDHMGNWVKGFSGYVGHGLPFEDLVKLKCPTPSEKETSVLIFLLSVPF
ncbi:reverse transcriptase [Senna tora]|uniref:Reverse transcriptase n=1 Tax=Senna tora TaxID=362788 RepID=A0A834WPR9_9FABA|nr:reverse transcriptase [Senna tora]